MILKIETGRDNPTLRKKSEVVSAVTKKTVKLIKDMAETMAHADGVGLAAPQIGVNLRIVLITLAGKKILPMINPKITSMSEKTSVAEEGCLSLPNEWGKVRRSDEITVEFQGIKGERITAKFKGMEAREAQHEIDHLDGVLFTDYLEDGHVLFNDLVGESEIEMV